MSVLLQVSDTHFGTENEGAVEGLVSFARELSPDLVVYSGDITQRARKREFDAARAWIDRLGAGPRVVLPGNHDIPLYNVPARVIAPYGGYMRRFGADLEPEHESVDLLVLGVNTTRARRHKDGEVSAEQIERVSRRLQGATRGQLRVVVTHQPVHVIRTRDEKNRLHGADAAVRAWSLAGADLILGGHIHLPYVRPLTDRYPDLPRPVWCVQAGTAVSTRVRDGVPNSFNVIRHSAHDIERCVVQRFDYDARIRRFALHDEHSLRLAREAPARAARTV